MGGILTDKAAGALDNVVQLVSHDVLSALLPLPGTNHSELSVEVRSHGPGVEDLPTLLHDRTGLGCGTNVESELVSIALVVNSSLGFIETVVASGMKTIVEVIRPKSI